MLTLPTTPKFIEIVTVNFNKLSIAIIERELVGVTIFNGHHLSM